MLYYLKALERKKIEKQTEYLKQLLQVLFSLNYLDTNLFHI